MNKAMEVEADLDGLHITVWRRRARPLAVVTDLLAVLLGLASGHPLALLLAVAALGAVGAFGGLLVGGSPQAALWSAAAAVTLPTLAVVVGRGVDAWTAAQPPVAVRLHLDAGHLTVGARRMPLHTVQSVGSARLEITLITDSDLIDVPVNATLLEDVRELADRIREAATAARTRFDGAVPDALDTLRGRPQRRPEGEGP